jgi:hypothetical protein
VDQEGVDSSFDLWAEASITPIEPTTRDRVQFVFAIRSSGSGVLSGVELSVGSDRGPIALSRTADFNLGDSFEFNWSEAPLPRGRYCVFAFADPSNAVQESDEGNNMAVLQFEVVEPPALSAFSYVPGLVAVGVGAVGAGVVWTTWQRSAHVPKGTGESHRNPGRRENSAGK